jgi:hypothetical protein
MPVTAAAKRLLVIFIFASPYSLSRAHARGVGSQNSHKHGDAFNNIMASLRAASPQRDAAQPRCGFEKRSRHTADISSVLERA